MADSDEKKPKKTRKRQRVEDLSQVKVDQVLEAAKQHGHPLQCVSEPVE